MNNKSAALRLRALTLPLAFSTALAMAQPDWRADNPLVVAHEMVNAWNALDVERMSALFAEDARFQSMMLAPMQGREVLREHFGQLLEGATALELRLRNIAASGNTVFLERVNVFTYEGREGSVPVVAVLEIEDGRVQAWREYYDRASLLSEMGLAEGGH
mgnify:FL=1